ncbi:hypothetical protein CPC16_002844 [Podila verticillata]|nr:hypothetical protein CPC16_002844 [Podila verticillata]
MEDYLAVVFSDESGNTAEDRKYYLENLKQDGFHCPLSYYRAFSLSHNEDLPLVGQRLAVPTLMMVVLEDPLIPPAYVRSVKMDYVDHLEYLDIEHGGHFVMTENPDAVNRGIKAYLDTFFGFREAANEEEEKKEVLEEIRNEQQAIEAIEDYIDEGNPKAKVIFLVHGFPDLWFGWRNQIRFLATKGYRVIAIDNLGHGETDQPRCVGLNVLPYRCKALCTNFVELLDQLNVSKAVFVGHDCAGNPYREPTAAYFGVHEMAAENPAFSYFIDLEKPEGDYIFGTDFATQSQVMFNITFDGKPGTSAQEKQYYIDSYSKQGFHGAVNYYRTFRLNYADELPFVDKPYTVPSLLITVENDPVLHPAYISTISKKDFVDLEMTSISEGTHFILTENPDAVNNELDRYLGKFFGNNRSEPLVHVVVGGGIGQDEEMGDWIARR